MITDPKFLIEKIATKDPKRRPLQKPYLDVEATPPVMVATDGRAMVVIQVESSDGDVSGHIETEALQKARKLGNLQDELMVNLACTKEGFKTINCQTWKRDDDGTFPNYKVITESARKPPCFQIRLNPALLLKVAQAMGVPSGETVRLIFESNADAVVVRNPMDSKAWGTLMPCRLEG